MEFAEVYLNLSGIAGAARAEGHEKEIELFDWRWGLELGSQSPTGKDEDRQAEGRMVGISKAVDVASVPMMQRLKSGDPCDKAVITVKQRTDKEVLLQVTLRNVRLKSCKLKVDCGDKEVVLDEDWDLAYERLEVLYQNKGAGGSTGAGGGKIFSLEVPPNSQQSEAARLTAPTSTKDGAPTGAKPDDVISKKEMMAMFEDFVKAKKIKMG